MLFNTFQFAFFFVIVFIFYWFVFNKSRKVQNIFLAVVSYYFYSCWDWRFMFLLAFSTLLDFYSGAMIFKEDSKQRKKMWLIISVVINLGLLCFFKYYNFFIDSLQELLMTIGFTPHLTTLSIIVPVGISFYTFHGLSYVFDIYYGRIKPSTNLINYSLFVSFFPLLVAGPIERATHLLPQMERVRKFDYTKAVAGCKQILWGLFKKMVIADKTAEIVNPIFANYETCDSSTLIFGALLFGIQIYGDFSGYTDIALGTARLLGFELLQNFNYPYFSRNIAEFWRRWHISLSSWFKDYLYIPLGGSKKGKTRTVINTFIIFLVSGFWHGSNWTFLAWGGLNALLIMPSIFMKTNRNHLNTVAEGRMLPNLKECVQLISTFLLANFTWIFFRSESIHDAVSYIQRIFVNPTFTNPLDGQRNYIVVLIFFFVVEWLGRCDKFAIEKYWDSKPKLVRWALYYVILVFIYLFVGYEQQFIYFQF